MKIRNRCISWRHSEVHPAFQSIWKNGGYGDLYLMNPNGLVLYSVTKGEEFLYTVDQIPGAEKGLKAVFDQAKELQEGDVAASSFAEYAAAGGDPSMFFAAPVFINTFGEISFGGVVAVRVTASMLDRVVADRTNMGETGQVYVVNSEGTYLSNKPLADYQNGHG